MVTSQVVGALKGSTEEILFFEATTQVGTVTFKTVELSDVQSTSIAPNFNLTLTKFYALVVKGEE